MRENHLTTIFIKRAPRWVRSTFIDLRAPRKNIPPSHFSGNVFRKRFTTLATVFWFMFRSMQYVEESHSRSGFAPLLELHLLQHKPTLRDIIDQSSHLSLSMCSHVEM